MTGADLKQWRTEREQKAYDAALTMHEILMREGSGRGMAYRRGWAFLPWSRHWTSYPVYCAGRHNREIAMKMERENAAK